MKSSWDPQALIVDGNQLIKEQIQKKKVVVRKTLRHQKNLEVQKEIMTATFIPVAIFQCSSFTARECLLPMHLELDRCSWPLGGF